MTRLQKGMIIAVTIVLVVAIVGIAIYMAQVTLTSREGVVFNVLLTIFSVIVSLIISHYYFETSRRNSIEDIKKDYQQNISTYARKAAEKVDNLSKELTKLSLYLQQDDDHRLSVEDAIIVKEERIRSVIHIIETLKSVNDRSLSDWRGVIPEEELEEQIEEQQERQGEMRQLLEDYRELLSPISKHYVEGNSDESLKQEMAILNRKIEKMASSIIGTPIKSDSLQPAREKVTKECPSCGAVNTYKQRPMMNSVKGLKCKECEVKLISRWNFNEGYTLSLKTRKSGEDSEQHSEREPIEEATLNLVRQALPSQPWPTGMSRDLAKQLSISHNKVRKIIEELINRGEFKVQINGVLYERSPVESETTKSKDGKKQTKKVPKAT